MPITISYDLSTVNNNDRNYIRSALERFGWQRMGGSVFRYAGVDDGHGGRIEDWMNHVVPALMFLRAFICKKNISLTALTIDAQSVAMLNHSDPAAPYGQGLQSGQQLLLAQPTNNQSSEQAVRDFVDACTTAAP